MTGDVMPDKRRAKTKSAKPAEGAQQPQWKQPPPRRRRRVHTNQPVSLRARLSQMESSLAERRSRPKTSKAAAARRAPIHCLLYTSDAADDLLCVDLGGRR